MADLRDIGIFKIYSLIKKLTYINVCVSFEQNISRNLTSLENSRTELYCALFRDAETAYVKTFF
jgi:hypothetical protein